MPHRAIGVAAMGGDSNRVLATIQDFERRGLDAAWLTTAGAGLDGLALLAAAAASTERIYLGTCITPAWPRHPVAAVQQVQVVAQLANGRFRFGVGTASATGMETVFGIKTEAPLMRLREYLSVVRTLLETGEVDFDGRYYHAKAKLPAPVPGVPVMGAALRPKAYEVCGELADGAISWVSPWRYLAEVALPALERGAAVAGRTPPPLIAHAPVCVHDDPGEVRAAAREQLAAYPRLPHYQGMFSMAGFPEAAETQTWSDAMVEAVVLSGNEEQVRTRVGEVFEQGISELIVTVLAAGPDHAASRGRTLDLLASLSAGQ